MTKEILFFKNQMEVGPELEVQRENSWEYERDTRNTPEEGLNGTK